MSGSGRKRVSKWDTKEEDTQHPSGNDYPGKLGFRDNDPEHARFYPESNGRNGSRRAGPDDDGDEHLKPRQHSGEAWPSRSRVSHDDGDAMMGYYDDPRNSSEQDESRQQYFRQSASKDRARTRRSGSRSNSRSRSRSPSQRVRRDGGGSYDRHKTRARVSPRSGREFDGRHNRAGDYDWDGSNRKTRDTKYYTEDSREQQPIRVGGRTDYSSDFPEDNTNSRRETSDPISRNYRNEAGRDRETHRRDAPEGEFHRSSNIPCRFFAQGSGYCRNGNNCRFSHHGAPSARGSPERKPQDEMYSRHDNNNNSGTTERMRNSHRWNDVERSDARKSNEVEISRVSKGMSDAKGNNSSWIDDMEMSPDWNYGVKTVMKPEEHGSISQSSQSQVLKDASAPAYEHDVASIAQQDGNRRTVGMFTTVGEKTVASSHHNNFINNLATSAPPVQAFNQNTENHIAVPYQSTPLAVGGSQVLLPAATNLPGGLNSSNPENGNALNNVSREELNHISNISASLAQFFGNGQPKPIPIPNLHSTLNPKQAMQVPEVYGVKEQSSHTQSDFPSNNTIHIGGVPAVPALQIHNSDAQQVRIPENLVSLAVNPKASSEENRDKKTDEEAGKKPDGKKTGEEEDEDAEEEEDDGAGDENNKKEKDPKGMRAFKFALVEIVKELLKPAWKEGGMNKDAYKNIVKKVVDKVTGAIQSGNIPQTQEKIDHYLSASKPKLTKLVQAYVSKVKKS
ncbi:PREDICTED: zinc finger CCCH domain-containing protein 38-like isoform X1 [Camelina sativa]|uniref:Zinc finger CCCH domain-containing protein 38-like isoform X1 n=1 Tax=Camelina sativa TaxID=90675 RepID=A0ABM0YG75_CAMSA|nr:PREDICTED: zinc finger CCCH domain-containing protein 38-like isoform X1 [Camelina sativa]XP_010500426.1 PREDICTED: zinc finger CCCH domain-containing protein 38-like isoform X1 [Camelina sativa]